MKRAGQSSANIAYDLRRYLSIKSAHAPDYSPDDSRIAYISDVTGVPQAWITDADGSMGHHQLTVGEDRVSFVSYAPKSDRIAFGVDSGGDERFQLKILENGGESLTDLTHLSTAIHNWGDWSPDEKMIAFSSNSRNQAYFDVYVQSLDDLSVRMVYQRDGNCYPLGWSPDSSSLLFEVMHAPFNQDLYLLDLNDGSADLLTPHKGDAAFSSATFDADGKAVYAITDEGREFAALARIGLGSHEISWLHSEDWDLEGFAPSRDKTRLAFTVNEGGYSRLKVWEASTKSARDLDAPNGVIGGLDWSNSGEKLAFSVSSSSANSDVWELALRTSSLRRVTRSSTAGIPESSFVEPELLKSRSFDGVEISSFFYLPRQSRPPYPLIVIMHGGPEGQYRPGFGPLTQYFLKLGFAVLASNFRGSTGYGRRFTHLDDVQGRMDTVADVHIALNRVAVTYPIDPLRIAAWGGSYGGFMVLACLYTKPDLWRAGVDIVGISNFVTFLNNTGPWRRSLRIAEYGDPVKDKVFLERISPNNNASLIKAPLFIIHGTNDPRVPLGEAEQIAETLTKLGREVHMLKFDDEGHGLTKLKNRIAGYSAAVEFLAGHLLA